MNTNGSIHVINRAGQRIPLSLSAISERLTSLIEMEPKLSISADSVAIKTASALVDNIKTSEIDMISAGICASLIIEDYEYDALAARIMVSNLHSMVPADLRKYADGLRSYTYREHDIKILHPKVIAFIRENSKDLHKIIDYSADYQYNYFGVVTLMNSYLLAYKYDNDVKVIKERPQQMLMRVAIGIHMNMISDEGDCSDETFESISTTYDLLSKRYYTHATPTLFNAGTINHTLSSCYLLSIDDNLANIYSRLTDISSISKFSGGVGIHVSQVRAAGSVIGSTIGRSQGLVPMLRVYNESTRYVSQGGGKRKGSTAVYVEPWHADIEACLASQKQQGAPEILCRDLFLAIWMPDLFMERLKQAVKSDSGAAPVMWSLMCPDQCKGLADVYGDEFKHLYESYERAGRFVKQIPILTLWNLIVSTQIETGKPYIMYKDHVNRKSNQSNLGVIKSSNLCVAGDTKILTKTGYQEIQTLAGQNVEVWNGSEWSLAPVAQTGTDQELLKVQTDDGCELLCTKYHKFSILEGYGPEISTYKPLLKEAQTLKTGDVLAHCAMPITTGNSECNFKYAYTHGFYCGDGTNNKRKDGSRKSAVCDLYGPKQLLAEHLEHVRAGQYITTQDKVRVVLPKDIREKYEVPLDADLTNRLEWLAGLFDADGTIVQTPAGVQSIQLDSIHLEFLRKVLLMMTTIGLRPKIKTMHEARSSSLPRNDRTGEYAMYNCSKVYRLLINTADTYKLCTELGMKTHRLVFNNIQPTRTCPQYIRVASVEQVGGLHDTYCFNEPKKHLGIFNGMLAGNCSEITLYTDEKNIGVCNLASICLPKFVNKSTLEFDYKKLYEVMQQVVYNMNRVMDNNKYPLEQAAYSDDQNRPIGIGVQGLAEVFMMMRQPFDSPKSREVNRFIFETMHFAALTASNKLAQVHGAYKTFPTSLTAKGVFQPDLWANDVQVRYSGMWDWETLRSQVKKTGLRNSLLMAQMPTAGTSIIMEHTESIEVPQSNVFTRSTLSGRFQVVNKHLMRDLKKLGLWTPRIRNQLIANEGSIADITEIPLDVREIYKTVYEYKLSHIIEMSADREAFICQSSSNNRYIVDPSAAKLTKMHLFSWKAGLKTSSYYVRCKQLTTGKKLIVEVPKVEAKPARKTRPAVNWDAEVEECTMCSA